MWKYKYTLIQVFVFSSLELFPTLCFVPILLRCCIVDDVMPCNRIRMRQIYASKPSENSTIFLCFIWRAKYYLKWNTTDSLPNGHMIIRNVYYTRRVVAYITTEKANAMYHGFSDYNKRNSWQFCLRQKHPPPPNG